ncbi:MAG: hypothetical protein IIY16_06815 [Oscillospiraceae bacterium]|nr:hypothetical protein [Oscillospiraceae bacterium]
MKKTLKRLYARLILLGWVGGTALLAIGAFTKTRELVVASMFLWLAALVARYAFLRCPHCGYMAAPPQWNKNATIRCPQCGEPFTYDN